MCFYCVCCRRFSVIILICMINTKIVILYSDRSFRSLCVSSPADHRLSANVFAIGCRAHESYSFFFLTAVAATAAIAYIFSF